MRLLKLLAPLPLIAGLAPAQHTILLIGGTSTENTLGIDAPEIDTMRPSEIYSVTPVPGIAYTARPFLPVSLQWHYVGDNDTDGQYVEDTTVGSGPANNLDAVFIKAGTVGPVTPRDVYFSIASATSPTTDDLPGVVNVSDVLRYSAQGAIEKFLTQAQLNVACGLTSTSTTMNLDALCQSVAGDLFFSLATTTTVNGTSMVDGDLLYIPASAINYDVDGNVSTITGGTAVRLATDSQMIAMATASGYKSSVGGTISPTSTSFDISGLEMDPNGGTWVSPEDLQSYPNVIFCWDDFSNDGALISTNGGGTIATINGVPMASLVATQGTQIGMQPTTTGIFGPSGFALIPMQQHTHSLLNYPRNLHTAGTGDTLVQLQVSGGTPFGFTILAWSPESTVPGGAFPSFPTPPGFTGNDLGMISAIIIIGLYPNDALGNSQSELMFLSSPIMAGANLAAQAVDVTNFHLSTPSAFSFL
jgi:hypothetical protein